MRMNTKKTTFWLMYLRMFRRAYYQKVIKVIIEFIAINMVYVLVWFKNSTNLFFYHKPMLSNVAPVSKGMFCGNPNHSVALIIDKSSTFPVRIVIKREMFNTFIPSPHSFGKKSFTILPIIRPYSRVKNFSIRQTKTIPVTTYRTFGAVKIIGHFFKSRNFFVVQSAKIINVYKTFHTHYYNTGSYA